MLDDKDAGGILRALAPVVEQFVITQSDSERAIAADDLAAVAVGIVGPDRVTVEPYSVIDGAEVGSDCQVGPFARLPPASRLLPGARVGGYTGQRTKLS